MPTRLPLARPLPTSCRNAAISGFNDIQISKAIERHPRPIGFAWVSQQVSGHDY
jgi:hypothetical protein